MASKHAQLVKDLEAAGFDYVRRSTNGYAVYAHPTGLEAVVHDTPSEENIKQTMNLIAKSNRTRRKRSGQSAKERNAATRRRASALVERKKAEVRALVAMKETELAKAADDRRIRAAQLDGTGAVLTNREATNVSRRIERDRADRRALVREMQEIPLYGGRD